METMRKAGSLSLAGHGVLMLGLGMSLCALGSVMANPDYDALGYALAAGLAAASLLIVCINARVLKRQTGPGRHQAIHLVAASVIACWLTFWLIQSASVDIRLLVLIAGLHGTFWGLWFVKLAFSFQSYSGKAIVLCGLAGITSTLGIVLATWSGLSNFSAVTAAACYMTFIGIEILLTAALLHREVAAETDFAGWQEREIETDSTQLEIQQYSYAAPPTDSWDKSH